MKKPQADKLEVRKVLLECRMTSFYDMDLSHKGFQYECECPD
ncbi:hypothetical protein [Bartonella sp. B1098]|nr:hypothetical protein [Bartonella sp. B1098]